MLQKSEEKILNLIRISPLFIILISIFVIYLVIDSHNKNIQDQIEEAKQQSISEKKALIKREVVSVYNNIQKELKHAKLNIKKDVKNRVKEAITIANSIYKNNRDKDEKLIKKLIVDALRDIRFNNSRGYFFIYDLDGNNVMHPILTKIEGKSMWNFQDKKGMYPIQESVKISRNTGEGFLTWWWTKPRNQNTEYEKIGFIEAFKPYNWFIGTGEYVIDYENALKKELIKKIQTIRYNKDGYIFVIDYEGTFLSHVKKEYLNTNRINHLDKNNLKTVQDVINTAKDGEGYLSYIGSIQPSTGKPAKKISYIKGFDKWSWAIGAGVYLVEIQSQINKSNSLIMENNKSKFNNIVVICLFIFGLIFILSFYLAKVTKRKFLQYKNKTLEKTKELAKLNNTLEQKVEERTKELYEQKNIFETLFNDTSDGNLLIKDGKFVDCNNSVLELLGYTKEELLKADPSFISPKYQPDGKSSKVKAKEMLVKCLKDGSHRFEWIHLTKNGKEIWFEIVLTKLLINKQIIVHDLWRDISDKKRLELENLERNTELLRQKNLFETLVNSIPDIVWMKDKEGRYIQCNHRFTEFFGANQKEIIGKTDYDFVDKELADFFRENDNKAMNSKKPNVNYEVIPFASDGHDEYTQTIKTAVRNKEGLILGILGIGRDFTKEHEQKEELEKVITNLKQTQDKLIEAEKLSSLGVLVAGIAHEINTPVGIGLTGVTHFQEITEKLEKDYRNEDMSQEKFEEFLSSSKEIAELINSNLHKAAHLVKSFKQISFDQSSEEKREINLKEYIDELLFSMHTIIRKTNILVVNNCDKSIIISTYPGAISQIITNLIINSIRHGFEEKEEGQITIEAHQQEQVIKLVYTDTGAGIDEKNLPKIFDPFFTTNREKGGTGLGLNIF